MRDDPRSSTVSERARRHAALGEPVRLGIVDRLQLGDASPGELGALVELPTNLLAHHLRVLEGAGLIRRTSSEGDGRRSYVQLRLDDPQIAAFVGAAAPAALLPVRRVVFVCTHNSARSQLAAAAWAHASSVAVASAGTHPAARVHPRAMAVGRRHGLRLRQARPRRLAEIVQPTDLLVAVCDNAYEELAVASPPARVWLHWSIPDPVRIDTDEAFETAYTHITGRVDRLAATLRAAADTSSGDI